MKTLYHHTMSTGSRFIRLLLSEYEQEIELIEENVWDRRTEFLQVNPAGTLPVLKVDENKFLCGAFVINEYLDETTGIMMRDRRLMPEKSLSRAEVRRLIEWFLIKFENEAANYLVNERVMKLLNQNAEGGSAPNSSTIRAARANLKIHLAYVDNLMASRDWIAGEVRTCADLAAAASISVLDYLGEIPWDEYPQARDWYASMKSIPSFRPLLKDTVKGFPPSSHYTDLDF